MEAERPHLRSILHTGGILAVGQVCLRGSVAVYTLVLVHVMSRPAFGDLAYLLALLGLLSVLADGGLSRVLIRDIARDPDNSWPLVRAVVAVRTMWILIVVALVAVVGLATQMAPAALGLLILALGCEASAGGFEAAAIGGERPRAIAGGQLAGAAVLVTSTLIIVNEGRVSLAGGIGSFAAASGVKLGWHLVRARRVLYTRRPRATTRSRDLIAAGLPFLVLAVLGSVYYRIDMVILHALKGSAAAAPYGAAYRVVDAALVFAGVLAATISPSFSRLHERSRAEVWMKWRRVVLSTLAAAVVPVLGLVAFAFPIAKLLFGARYQAGAGTLLRILAPGIIFMMLQTVNAVVLFTSQLDAVLVRMSILPVLTNVVLTLALVAALGSVGAALATTVAEVGTFAFYATFITRSFSPRPVSPQENSAYV